jgi:hypothetical protein
MISVRGFLLSVWHGLGGKFLHSNFFVNKIFLQLDGLKYRFGLHLLLFS